MALKGSANFGPRGSTALGFGGHAHRAFPQIADLGEYEDRHIWLCYHPQDGTKNVIAIEGHDEQYDGIFYDIISDIVFSTTKVKMVDNWTCYVENLCDFQEYGRKAAKFIYDMDNNRFGRE